ncbi:hypothetical protein P5673_015142 [Acropora cervicornis]|uniref:Uncharacterized protein n=1 Tax=Acropora cervicornis TaxID=6130 RepID=A0AAD9QIF7_ACRCE|nr:hypothetical protein P5673_015142 [Acropora cervicornis]
MFVLETLMPKSAGGYFKLPLLDLTFPMPARSEHHKALDPTLALLEGVQRRATKFILRDYELPYRLRLVELNPLPISYWLELKDLLFSFKSKQGYFDIDISQYLTFSSQRSSHTSSSQAHMLLPNFCCTSLFRASFFNRIVFLRNGLPSSTRDISSVLSFKHNLFSHYLSKLNSDFNVNRTRSWKTFCCKCRSYNINCCS